jgi:hypothetical protein
MAKEPHLKKLVMQPTIITSLYHRHLWALALLLLAGLGMAVPPQASAAVFYSTTSQFQSSTDCTNPLVCGGGVYRGSRAADTDLNNYATIYSASTSGVWLRLGLNGTGNPGDRAGVVVSNGSFGLLGGIQVIGAVTIRTYLQAGTSLQLQESRIMSPALVKAALLDRDTPTQLEITASLPFNQVEIEVGSLINLTYLLRVHYAYAVPSRVQSQVSGYISRFGAAGSTQYSTAGTGSSGVCVNTDVDNPDRAVDNDLSNYASFRSLVTVGCPATLSTKLEGTSPAGYYAGFMLGSAGLLDASVLSGLRITTLLNGVPQETHTGADLLTLNVLPNGQAQVSFPTAYAFNEVRVERVGLLTALDNLRIYYGFGVEPRAFEGNTNVLSNFGNPAGHYQASTNGLLCAACSIVNPENAANSSTAPNSYAQMNMPLTLGGEQSLRLQLNGTGSAGNRAGVVVGGSGLLDISALDNMVISTYDANNNLLESRVGRDLLSLRLLPDGRQEVFFNTTRDFSSVQLTVASGLSALSSTRVYYAFADDRTGDFPLLVTPPVPLPVELTAFTARWNSGCAELSWATASEKNSSHFVVERSTGSDATFRAMGVVAAAGNSNSPQQYLLRDTDAAKQNVKMVYYRLRQVDKDDKEAFSPVVALKVGPAAVATQLQLYPNPATEAVTLSYNGPASATKVEVYSEMGQLVRQQPMTEVETKINTTSLASGLYHVILRDAAGQRLTSQRLVVAGR